MSSLTHCGIPGIRQIPYGVHMCQFYERREDLVAALVPYFVAGLRNRERCIWITAEPLDAEEAKRELRKAGLDVDAAERKGALTVRDYADWYAKSGNLKGTEVIEQWLAAEAGALARGYKGLRITGNLGFLTGRAWPAFMEYEQAVQTAFHGRRIVTICSYRLGDWGAAEILEAAQRHDCALDRPDKGWQLLTRAPL